MPVDVNRLRSEGVYEAREPVASLTDDLYQVQRLASDWHSSRRKLSACGAACILLGLFTFFGFVPGGLALLGIGIWLLYHMKVYPAPVANHMERCEFGRSIAAMLAADTDPKELVTMRLVFEPKEEVLSEGPLKGYKNGKQRLFRVCWFSISAKLYDGSTFSETVEDVVRERKYTSTRGKRKTKTRTRSLIGLRLDYPSERYGDVSALQARMRTEMYLPEGVKVRGVEVNDRAIKAKIVAQAIGIPQLVKVNSMLALGIYRVLNLSLQKRGGKP